MVPKVQFMSCRRPFNPTHSVPAAIHCLSRLLRERSVRILFQRVSGSVQLLAPLLRSNASAAAPNQQLLYEAGMCVWQLTFYEPAAQAMGSSGVVQGLVDMARSATKEKVIPQVCLKERRQERSAPLGVIPRCLCVQKHLGVVHMLYTCLICQGIGVPAARVCCLRNGEV